MSEAPVLRVGLCHVIMAKMRGPRCEPSLVYLPGTIEPMGVLLTFPATEQSFVCLVSEPKSTHDLGDLFGVAPLPFPED